MEDDGRIDAVKELWSEHCFELRHDLVAHLRVIALLLSFGILFDGEAKVHFARDLFSADVRGHDDDRVAEIDLAPLGVGEIAVFHDLEEHVEGFRVGLLDFVEQDDRVRLAPDGLGKLTALFVADVARRCADQAGNGVAFHELRHVDLDQVIFRAKHELGEHFGDERLTDTGRSKEDE